MVLIFPLAPLLIVGICHGSNPDQENTAYFWNFIFNCHKIRWFINFILLNLKFAQVVVYAKTLLLYTIIVILFETHSYKLVGRVTRKSRRINIHILVLKD